MITEYITHTSLIHTQAAKEGKKQPRYKEESFSYLTVVTMAE